MNGHSNSSYYADYSDEEAYYAAMDAFYQYEVREWNVECECGHRETATQKELELRGWHLSKTEYCPACVKQIAALGYSAKQYEMGISKAAAKVGV
jgi:hypothetical protein